MTTWNWIPQKLPSGAIVDAVAQINAGHHWTEIDLVDTWSAASTYLEWAVESLKRDDAFGWDAAVCYAKRAACRQIDAFMVSNHLGNFLQKRNYPEKVKLLNELGIDIPDMIHELIIDPRNDIEHAYVLATKQQARHAVQLCKLLLTSIAEEARYRTIVTLGMQLGSSYTGRGVPGFERQEYKFELAVYANQMMLVDYFAKTGPKVIVLVPKTSELLFCSLDEMPIRDVMDIAALVRKQKGHPTEGFSRVYAAVFDVLKQDIGLGSLTL